MPGDPIDPVLFERDDLRSVLAVRDISALYRALTEAGISQHRIARATGQAQSDVSEIIAGRRVIAYDVLERISGGLGIPREYLGLGYGQGGAYRGVATDADTPEGVHLEMLRRHLIALGGVALTGATVTKLGQLLDELPGPPPVPLPGRLSATHVTQVQDLTRRLDVGDTYCDSQVCSSAAILATRLLSVPGPDPMRQRLLVAVAELHSVAGWAAFDAGLHRCALYHHARTLELGTEAGDPYLQTLALNYSALVTVENGHPDDGLKLRQLAQVKAWDIPQDDHRAVVVGEVGKTALQACALEGSAEAAAMMGDLDTAVGYLMKGRDLWTPTVDDPFGDMDRPAARLELARGRLDAAERFAVASVRRWNGGRQISRTTSGIVLATVHIRAGDSGGLPLAQQTITDASRFRSARVRRQWLLPLADALDTRPGSDAQDLARTARQVAAA
ncbi:MAG TPA: helix-turn-helix transcriptional regulator [Pseudonocardiaceae bacterium]|jgi:transcriptional regulator with XRE-family HTH domain